MDPSGVLHSEVPSFADYECWIIKGYQTAPFSYKISSAPKWRNGRRAGLKNRSGQPGVSSTLTFGTTLFDLCP